MGFLGLGVALDWEDSKKYVEYVKQHGLLQFLNIFKQYHNIQTYDFLFGDEIECHIVNLDPGVSVCLRAYSIIEKLQKISSDYYDKTKSIAFARFIPEYGRWMIESTPERPYCSSTTCLLLIEPNMRLRRKLIESFLESNEYLFTLSVVPTLGLPNCTHPSFSNHGPIANSDSLPDEVIHPHTRFPTLTKNIRTRRGSKVIITVPRFIDTHTIEKEPIIMDAMAFGMGCCCVQCTFQTANIDEARYLYDQLAIISPIIMALSAATPIFKGILAATDVRWSVISQAVDDRTPNEREFIAKSRYAATSCFISKSDSLEDKYNDIKLEYRKEHFDLLINNGVDKRLAEHIAHLFIRDPLVIYSERIHLDDNKHGDHWENIQSTNWQNVRFKPPALGTDSNSIGWRVEFRTIEVQLTDFENAAYVIFVTLLARAIVFFNINLYIPISKVDINMQRAHSNDAIHSQLFYWRTRNETVELSLKEILEGNSSLVGLIPLVKAYLLMIQCENNKIWKYISFIEGRAVGRIQTTAKWIRNYIKKHPSYKHDSNVTPTISLDLLKDLNRITHHQIRDIDLLGNEYYEE